MKSRNWLLMNRMQILEKGRKSEKREVRSSLLDAYNSAIPLKLHRVSGAYLAPGQLNRTKYSTGNLVEIPL